MNAQKLTEHALDTLFRTARTANAWQDKAVPADTLRQIYDVMKFGPTSANSSPLRIVFLQSDAAKARLKPFLMESNIDKTMSAPVVAIFAMDMAFHDHLPFLFPHTDAKSWFEGNADLIAQTAFRNSTLQAAYFMIAARAHGLDCGPMSGFDADKVNQEFFPDGKFKVNFICNIGYADAAGTFARSPRFEFDQMAQVL
ncbi:MAG: malonic semialdehyde reductase [Bdellovibrionales bacterium]|jgi:3-hydroxypropanoate dehydrogenase|nr:malonic semialdehyde reductase [Bdellovibrionales bacterium]